MKKNIESVYPLSSMQEGMLFHTLQLPGSGVYFQQLACTLQGQLDTHAFRQACQRVVDHHSVLRTAFVWESQIRQLQVVFRNVTLPWKELDWRSIPAQDQAARLEDFVLQADRGQGFELDKPPVMRMTLIRLDEDKYRFIWSYHHILLDGWSLMIVLKDIFSNYERLRQGKEFELSPQRPYKDYITWIQDQDLAEAESFWRKTLEGFTTPTSLTKVIGQYAGDKVGEYAEWEFRLPSETIGRLQELARQHHLTLNTIVQGAWALLLSRYSGEQDIVFGTTVSGRPPELEGVESMVGLFINTLPLRVRVEPDMHLIPWLQALQAHQAEMRQYEYSPLVQVQNWSSVPRGTSLFENILVFENVPVESTFREANLSLEVQDMRTLQRSNYPMNVVIWPPALRLGESAWTAGMSYDTLRFERDTVKQLSDHLKTLLSGFRPDPDLRLIDIPLLTELERQQVLIDWNNTQREFHGPACLHQLFERQVTGNVGQSAVCEVHDFDDTYKLLESRVTRSHHLERLGQCCFKRNPYIFKYPHSSLIDESFLGPSEVGVNQIDLIRTHWGDLVALNGVLESLLVYFDGHTSLASLFQRLKDDQHEFVMSTVSTSTGAPSSKKSFILQQKLENLVSLAKALYAVHLIDLVGFSQDVSNEPPIQLIGEEKNSELEEYVEDSQAPSASAATLSPVLLLGANPGTATVGIMYLASYLRRHGVEAYCQVYDAGNTRASLEQNIRQLLETIQPKMVGISLKWFPHIARGLEICKLVKQYAPGAKIVLGGDTASYFYKELIENECVDYIVRGEGDLPLLQLARGEENAPNTVYKRAGQVIQTPFDYVHTADDCSEIHLSNLAEIFTSTSDLFYISHLFIPTGLGCSMRCFYCAGACENQQRVFNRPAPYVRPVEDVRKDILRVKKYAAEFLFDFDLPHYDVTNYYRKLWEGLDLKSHFGSFYAWGLPSKELVDLLAETFSFVHLQIDLCSLSEHHRLYLSTLKIVKPQPTDEELFALLDVCERHANISVGISLISGLPYFTQNDITDDNEVLTRILNTYTCFRGLEWGRLHAQPGAPITLDYDKFDMSPSATTYEDYLKHSLANMQDQERYPDVALLDYPLIYYKDSQMNSLVSKHYADVSQRVSQYAKKKRRKVRFYHKDMSYRQVDERANQLAQYLSKLGVKPGVKVGICLERSAEMIVAILGVLKAGGAYVPLDPAYPQERLAYMIQDSGVAVLLTQETFVERLPEHTARLVCVDRDGAAIAREASTPPGSPVRPDDLAYVIYTSGSTGKPKGVMVEHRSASNLVQSQIESFDVRPDSRVLQFASLNFDASVSEIFTTLASGARLHVVNTEALLLGEALADLLRAYEISVLTLPPSLLRVLEGEQFPALETIVSAGEACQWEEVERWARGRRFLNFYGPTEATVGACCYAATERVANTKTVPIGRPIDNVQVYILDSHLQPVPEGVAGELVIGGAGVARGYLNQPDLTTEKFIANPFDSGGKARLYKTGDLVRYLPGGDIEFLGRIDHQVKIRGFRVELGEIEAALGQHPAIQATVTIVHQEADRKQLVTYFVPAIEPPPTGHELRDFLKERLPGYMIPAIFVTLEALPLSSSGKVDRNALPSPGEGHMKLEQALTPPRNALEQALVDIWAKILHRKQVGIHDNFFDLGGDSIQSVQIAAAASRVGVPLTTRQIFQHQTIAELAATIGVVELAS